jgi:ATP-dependent Clp protease ATP-binding subunit ClpC
MNSADIDTGHLLLGLLSYSAGQPNNAGEVLTVLGVPALAVHDATLAALSAGGSEPSPSHIPFTRQSKKAMELTLRGSFILGDNFVGTGHLLYGLARNTESTAGRVLAGLGITYEKVHDAIKGILPSPAPTAERVVEVFIPAGKSVFKNGGKIYPDLASAQAAHPCKEIAPFTVPLNEGEFFDVGITSPRFSSWGKFASYPEAFAAAEEFSKVQGADVKIRIMVPDVMELRGKDSRGHDVVLGRSIEYSRVSLMHRLAAAAEML